MRRRHGLVLLVAPAIASAGLLVLRAGPTRAEPAAPAGHVVVLLPAGDGPDQDRLAAHLGARVEDLGYAVTVVPASTDAGLSTQVDQARQAGQSYEADAVVWLHSLGGTRLMVFLSGRDQEQIIARDLDLSSAAEADTLEALAIIVRSVLRAHVTLTSPPPEPPAEPPPSEPEPEGEAPAAEGPAQPAPAPAEAARRGPAVAPRAGLALLQQGTSEPTAATLFGGYVGLDIQLSPLVRVGLAAWILTPAKAESDAGLTMTLSRVPMEITALLLWQIGSTWIGLRTGVLFDSVSARSSTQTRADSFEVGIPVVGAVRLRLFDRVWAEAEVGLDLFFSEHRYEDPEAESPVMLELPWWQPRVAIGVLVDIN